MTLLSVNSVAGNMYKCTVNGVTAYQHAACSGSAMQTVIAEKKQNKSEIGAGEQFEEGILLGPLYVKKDHVDRLGDQWLVYKVTVTNNTDSERKVFLKYKGIDSDGFMVKQKILDGTIPAHTSKSLTDDGIMTVPEFNRTQQWVLDR